MAGCDRVEPEDLGPLGQPGELHAAVALDTRVRRQPADVGRHVRSHDVLVEVVAEVEHEVVDVELLCDTPCVVDVGDAATSGVTLTTPQPHRDADHRVSGVEQAGAGDGRVDASAHGQHHLHYDRLLNAAVLDSTRLDVTGLDHATG